MMVSEWSVALRVSGIWVGEILSSMRDGISVCVAVVVVIVVRVSCIRGWECCRGGGSIVYRSGGDGLYRSD